MIADHGVFDIFVKFLMCKAYGNGSRTWCSRLLHRRPTDRHGNEI